MASKALGPATPAGKRTSSKNAIKHGLTAKSWIDHIEQDEYQNHLKQLVNEYQPTGYTQKKVVESLATTLTLLDRCHRIEDNLYAIARKEAEHPSAVFASYQNEQDESFQQSCVVMTERASPGSREFTKSLINCISQIDLNRRLTLTDIANEFPAIRVQMTLECNAHQLHLPDLLKRYESLSTAPTPTVIDLKPGIANDEQLEQANREYFSSGAALNTGAVRNYIERLYFHLLNRLRGLELTEEYDERSFWVSNAATPDSAVLDKIDRQRTKHQRQFQRDLAMLLTLKRS